MQMKECSLTNRNLSSSDKGNAVHPMSKMSHRPFHRHETESNYSSHNSRSFCSILAYPDYKIYRVTYVVLY